MTSNDATTEIFRLNARKARAASALSNSGVDIQALDPHVSGAIDDAWDGLFSRAELDNTLPVAVEIATAIINGVTRRESAVHA